MTKLDVQKIKDVTSDPGFEPVLKALEQRERDRGVTDIRQFYNSMREKVEAAGEKFPALGLDQTVKFFRDLGEAGFGTLIEGGRGQSARFKWRFKIKTVGPALRDPDNYANNVIAIGDYRPSRAKPKAEPTSSVNISEMKEKVAKRGRPRRQQKSAPVAAPSDDGVNLSISFKDDQMQVSFPTKLNAAQAARICNLIQSLAG